MNTTVVDGVTGVLRAAAVVLLALMPMLAGCGGDTSTSGPALTTDDNVTSGSGDSDGGLTGLGGEVDLGDFPIPAPAGGDFVASGGSGRTRLVVYQPSEYDAVVEVYTSWVADVADSDGPPPTIVADAADRQFGTSFQTSDIGIVQILLGETDGELRLTLVVIG